jgi:hypothetical protein
VYDDIASEDPTHSICLAGARESCRDARPVLVARTVPTQNGGAFHTFEPFLGKVGDRVLVGDPDPGQRFVGTIREIVPGQQGFNPPMAIVEDEAGDKKAVAIEAIERVIGGDDDAQAEGEA